MAIAEHEVTALFLNKDEIRRIVDEQNVKSGFVPDPEATTQKTQALVEACLRRAGLRPEDNIFSQGIIDARDEE